MKNQAMTILKIDILSVCKRALWISLAVVVVCQAVLKLWLSKINSGSDSAVDFIDTATGDTILNAIHYIQPAAFITLAICLAILLIYATLNVLRR